MQYANRDDLSIWNSNTIVSLLLTLPGIGLIAASLLLSNDSSSMNGSSVNFILLVVGSFFFLINCTVFILFLVSNRNRIQLIQHGLRGTARILDFFETNGKVNGMPILKFKLEINDGYHPQREMEHMMVVPLHKVPTLEKNMEFEIRVHRQKPDKILILMDSPTLWT